MIWLVSTILVAAVIVLYAMAWLAEAEAWPFGWLLRRLDTFHSELKARKLVREARRDIAERRGNAGGEG
jgi:hypothetical protein